MNKLMILTLSVFFSTASSASGLPEGFSMAEAIQCRQQVEDFGCGSPKDDREAFKKCVRDAGPKKFRDSLSKRCRQLIKAKMSEG